MLKFHCGLKVDYINIISIHIKSEFCANGGEYLELRKICLG